MPLNFPFQLVRTTTPPVTLGGRWSIPTPIIEVGIEGPNDTVIRRAVLDTGSHECYFARRIAMMIGIDLAGAPAGHHRGIDGIRHPVRYAPVRLRLSDGRTHLESITKRRSDSWTRLGSIINRRCEGGTHLGSISKRYRDGRTQLGSIIKR